MFSSQRQQTIRISSLWCLHREKKKLIPFSLSKTYKILALSHWTSLSFSFVTISHHVARSDTSTHIHTPSTMTWANIFKSVNNERMEKEKKIRECNMERRRWSLKLQLQCMKSCKGYRCPAKVRANKSVNERKKHKRGKKLENYYYYSTYFYHTHPLALV